MRAVLPAIRVPTLVMHRAGDRDAQVEEGRYIAEQHPGRALRRAPGRRCTSRGSATDAIVDEIEEFLTGARRGPSPTAC